MSSLHQARATVTVPAETLQVFIDTLFRHGGFTAEESARTADSLIQSSLRGHDSHGVVRCAEYIADRARNRIASDVALKVISETESLIAADAGFGLGQVQMPALLERLEEKVRANGLATGTLKNCGHAGRLGEWAEWGAERGLAAMVATNDNGVFLSTAPPGGKAARTSTNPMAFGIPLEGEPFILDMSTSAVAFGKLRIAHMSGEPCPPGWIQDANGLPSIDPSVLFGEPRGTLLPMGGADGYKGFGLALMIDCLVAGLSGGHCPPAREGAPYCNNVLCVLWDPERFNGLAHMRQEAWKLLAFVRETPMREGAPAIRLPGDRSHHETARRMRDGIPLGTGICNALRDQAARLGIPLPPQLEKEG